MRSYTPYLDIKQKNTIDFRYYVIYNLPISIERITSVTQLPFTKMMHLLPDMHTTHTVALL